MNSGDSSESGESNSSGQGEDKNIIDKILGEMKSEFNKTEKISIVPSEECNEEEMANEEPPEVTRIDSSLSNDVSEDLIKTEESTNHTEDMETSPETVADEPSDKPRIILSFKKPNAESPTKSKHESGRRSLRHKQTYHEEKIDESQLKRSARRRSKDCNESVLQSAIARKEKSYNEANKPQRLTRQLKPTQKILENLALAKQEKNKFKTSRVNSDRQKSNDSDSYNEADNGKVDENDRVHRKHKHKHHHHNKHNKKSKKMKSNHGDSSRDSDSDQSVADNNANVTNKVKTEEVGFRRSRRISSSRFKDDSNTDMDEQSLQESVANEESCQYSNNIDCSLVSAELINSRLCLCSQKTQYYLATNEEDITYCGAVDSIDDKIVGCSKVIDTKEIMMLRCSTRVPYMILCESHKNRLLRHNCCPTCGVFCTQGRFVECEAKHQYHRDCQISVGNFDCCPHCGLATPSYDVTITMHTSKRPIFLPVQRAQ